MILPSWREIANKLKRGSTKVYKYLRARCFRTDIPSNNFLQFAAPAFASSSDLAQHMRERVTPRFFIDSSYQKETVAALDSAYPSMRTQVVKAADLVCNHIFDLLGSGPTPLGDSIDWHCDFKTNHRWNPHQYFAFVRPASYPGGYDIKIPWELSRCQHFTWLGQAYWFTNDEKYAQAFSDQVNDWIHSNPPEWGVNWACTMDVAIRAVNWLWGYYYFKNSPTLTDDFYVTFFKFLWIHGRHIFRNLEKNSRVINNHYLANLVGLIYLGVLLPEFKAANTWYTFGIKELEKELYKQTYPDGTNFEGSVSYHRLALELFLSATLMVRLNNGNFSQQYLGRIEKMLNFIMNITQPDGTAPLIGDNDNGRLHRLKIWPDEQRDREWNDYRYLLAIGATLFDRKDFSTAAGNEWEEAFWLFGEKAFYQRQSAHHNPLTPESQSTHFPDFGVSILHSEGNYCALIAGPNGQKGQGGHAHNHALSFMIQANGMPWLIDPGTYHYTADYKARDLFRSTVFHNTIGIDEAEINPIDPRSPFTLPDIAHAEIKLFETNHNSDILWAIHYGYNRLSLPVTHHRQVFFHKISTAFWLVRDLLIGTGEHSVNQTFHCAPHAIEEVSEGILLHNNHKNGLALLWDLPGSLELTINQCWFSPGYGQRLESKIIHRTGTVKLPFEILTFIIPFTSDQILYSWPENMKLKMKTAYDQLPKIR
jgi:hypothetical protein